MKFDLQRTYPNPSKEGDWGIFSEQDPTDPSNEFIAEVFVETTSDDFLPGIDRGELIRRAHIRAVVFSAAPLMLRLLRMVGQPGITAREWDDNRLALLSMIEMMEQET